MEKKVVLLVEDEGVVRDLIRGALDPEYNVVEAATVSEARKQISKADIALIDYALPDGDGFDVLKTIHEMGLELPVIFMTAYSTDNLAIRAFRAGVADYIKKPLSIMYLMDRLSEILKGRDNKEDHGSEVSHEVFVMDTIAAFIRNNYMAELNRDELAKKVCMNRYKFSKEFNRRHGKSLKSYVNGVRMDKAKELLRSRDLGIATIAASVGYNGIEHFGRMFKKMYGVSPTEYRETLCIDPGGPAPCLREGRVGQAI